MKTQRNPFHTALAMAALFALTAASAPAAVIFSDDFSDEDVTDWTTSSTGTGTVDIDYVDDPTLGDALFADVAGTQHFVSHGIPTVTLTDTGDFIQVTATMRLGDVRGGGWNILLTGGAETGRVSFGTPTGDTATGSSGVGFYVNGSSTSVSSTSYNTGFDNSTSVVQDVTFLLTRTAIGYDFNATFSVSNTGSTTTLTHSALFSELAAADVTFSNLSLSFGAFASDTGNQSRDWLVTDVEVTTNVVEVIPTPAALPAGLMLLGVVAMRRRN
jgi:hypothetical protein